ncbi:DUF3492 domain-containing protein [Deinococcus sp. PESE-38]
MTLPLTSNSSPALPARAATRIALYTEGTYPQAHGGVSVWVDQLVRGLSDHQFAVQAIAGLPFTRMALEVPGNVQVEQVPLWGPPPAARAGGCGSRPTAGPLRARCSPPTRRCSPGCAGSTWPPSAWRCGA